MASNAPLSSNLPQKRKAVSDKERFQSANVLESILDRKLISSSGSTHRVAISLTSHRYLESSPLNTTTSMILRKNRFRIGIEYLNLTVLTSRQRYMNGSSDYRRKMQLLQAKSSNNRLQSFGRPYHSTRIKSNRNSRMAGLKDSKNDLR